MERRTIVVMAVVCALAVSSATAQMGKVGLNHDGGNTLPAVTLVGPAGVIPQTNWNNVTNERGDNAGDGVTGSLNNVIDSTGAMVVGMTFNWSAYGSYAEGTTVGENGILLHGGLQSEQADYGPIPGTLGPIPNEFNVSGIPYLQYDLYVYLCSWGDDHKGHLRINGLGGPEVSFRTYEDYPGAWTQAAGFGSQATHALFTGLTGSDLTIEWRKDASMGETDGVMVAGLQIVEVPEPASMALLAAGALALLRRRKR